MWIARNRSNDLVAFNDKPENSGSDYFRCECTESEVYINDGVELPSDADEKLFGKHIEFEDGAIEIN